MSRYRPNIEGERFSFTVLAERSSKLLVKHKNGLLPVDLGGDLAEIVASGSKPIRQADSVRKIALTTCWVAPR
jgi:hypothetical protein